MTREAVKKLAKECLEDAKDANYKIGVYPSEIIGHLASTMLLVRLKSKSEVDPAIWE